MGKDSSLKQYYAIPAPSKTVHFVAEDEALYLLGLAASVAAPDRAHELASLQHEWEQVSALAPLYGLLG